MMIDTGTTVAHGPWAHTQCEAAPGSNRAVYAVWGTVAFRPFAPFPWLRGYNITCHVREACQAHSMTDQRQLLARCGYISHPAKFETTKKRIVDHPSLLE